MKRLFTFGCSFTQYCWPTWADILGRQFDFYQNWGKNGAGNLFIACAVSECHVKNLLNEDDTVVIMWSGTTREDRYYDNHWHTEGSIFGPKQEKLYGKNWVKTFADPRGYLIRDLAMINLVAGLLDSFKVKYYFLSMLDIAYPEYENTPLPNTSDVIWHYQSILEKIRPSVHNVIFNYDYNSRPSIIVERDSSINRMGAPVKFYFNPKKIRQDHHPIPTEHLEYLDRVLPEITIDEATRAWVQDITKKLEDPDWDIESVWKGTDISSPHIPVKL